MKKPVINPSERECPECEGTGSAIEGAGSAIVRQPARPGVRIYPERCKECLGKGRVAN